MKESLGSNRKKGDNPSPFFITTKRRNNEDERFLHSDGACKKRSFGF